MPFVWKLQHKSMNITLECFPKSDEEPNYAGVCSLIPGPIQLVVKIWNSMETRIITGPTLTIFQVMTLVLISRGQMKFTADLAVMDIRPMKFLFSIVPAMWKSGWGFNRNLQFSGLTPGLQMHHVEGYYKIRLLRPMFIQFYNLVQF